jgi:DNA processing protein
LISSGLVDHGFVTVSGGALGIDTEVHRSTLDSEGITIAILGSGLAVEYPASNRRLFEEISEHGAVISEVMPHVTARPERFLTRNRLIAAIASATVVIEAAHRSGSLRTARDAAELLRPVMAIPGLITSPTSEGCHRLISDRSAEIVTSVTDVVAMISPL